MISQQILLNEPARALPVGAKIDWDAVVDDDGERGPHYGTRMRAGTIGPAEQIIKPGFYYHAGTVVFGELQKLSAEPISVADDRVDEVLGRLPLNGDHVLQTGEGIVPRR
jgi:hypothetical protein